MPDYDVTRIEDMQRIMANLKKIQDEWRKYPNDPERMRTAAEFSRNISKMTGVPLPDFSFKTGDPDSMNAAIEAFTKAGVGTPNFRVPDNAVSENGTPRASFGMADGGLVAQNPETNLYGNGQERRDNPYSFIVNPNAYEYGGRKGMAQEEQTRFGGLANAAAADKLRYEQQYQQGIDKSYQSRDEQTRGLGYLRGMAEGTGPSAAMQQMNVGLANARNQQASIAASARGGGGNLAAAQAASAQAAGQMGLQAIQQGSALRSQEQMGAMAQYGQLAGQMREGDFDAGRLGAAQQAASAGQQAQWESYRQAVAAQQAGYQQAAEQQNLAREGAIRGWEVAQQQQRAQEQAQWIAAATGAVSGLGSLASAFQPKPKATP